METHKGSISAEKIIVATHFPLWNMHGAYFLKLYQQRSYVLALKTETPVEGMYLDCEDNGLSVQGAGAYLLLGGGGHRTGKEGLCWKLPEKDGKITTSKEGSVAFCNTPFWRYVILLNPGTAHLLRRHTASGKPADDIPEPDRFPAPAPE